MTTNGVRFIMSNSANSANCDMFVSKSPILDSEISAYLASSTYPPGALLCNATGGVVDHTAAVESTPDQTDSSRYYIAIVAKKAATSPGALLNPVGKFIFTPARLYTEIFPVDVTAYENTVATDTLFKNYAFTGNSTTVNNILTFELSNTTTAPSNADLYLLFTSNRISSYDIVAWRNSPATAGVMSVPYTYYNTAAKGGVVTRVFDSPRLGSAETVYVTVISKSGTIPVTFKLTSSYIYPSVALTANTRIPQLHDSGATKGYYYKYTVPVAQVVQYQTFEINYLSITNGGNATSAGMYLSLTPLSTIEVATISSSAGVTLPTTKLLAYTSTSEGVPSTASDVSKNVYRGTVNTEPAFNATVSIAASAANATVGTTIYVTIVPFSLCSFEIMASAYTAINLGVITPETTISYQGSSMLYYVDYS